MYRFQGLDSLMTSRGITDSKTFEAYLKAVFSKRENQDENFAGFEWDAPQINFTYEMLQAEKQIEVMASYVDLNAPASYDADLDKLLYGNLTKADIEKYSFLIDIDINQLKEIYK